MSSRIATPSMALVLVIPLTIVLAGSLTLFVFELGGLADGPDAPEFDGSIELVEESAVDCESVHVVEIDHREGEEIPVEDVEVEFVHLGTERRNVVGNLPPDGRLDATNVDDVGDLTADCVGGAFAEGGNWTAGETGVLALDSGSQAIRDGGTVRVSVVYGPGDVTLHRAEFDTLDHLAGLVEIEEATNESAG